MQQQLKTRHHHRRVRNRRGRSAGRSSERPLEDLWSAVLKQDLALVWMVHDAVTTWPRWMQLNLARVVSHHPLRDVSIITWFMFLIGCRIFGFHFFWACCLNLVGAGFLRLVIAAPRPFNFDQRLRPLADRYHSSHGLPSIETHMATVVSGWWAESAQRGNAEGLDGGAPLAWVAAVSYVIFVGFTRVYACSRFVHQVTLSAASGCLGLLLGRTLSSHLDGVQVLVKHHIFGTAVVVIVALGVVAFHVENNESQLFGLTKQEYLRVLTNIVNDSDTAQSAVVGVGGSDADTDSVWEMEQDVTSENRGFSARTRRRRLEDRRDSFYFLQRSVERRAARRAASRLSTEDGEWSADRFWSQDPRSPRFAPAAMGWTNRNTATGGSRGGGGLEESLRGEMNKREGARGGRWADERSKRAFEPDLIASRDKAYRAN